jgi:flagellum-specific ATP synthase
MPTWRVDPPWRYRAGFSAEVDQVISLHRPLEEFLAQGKEEATSLGQGYQRLEQILARAETEN